jgi:hypothetical protein
MNDESLKAVRVRSDNFLRSGLFIEETMTKSKQITRADYREKLFTPLGSTFGVPIAFNANNRIAGGRALGIYVNTEHTIVIRYHNCPVSLFGTVAHEIGHATDPTLNPEALHSLKHHLHSGHRSYEEALAWFVSYCALRFAGVEMPSEKERSDELIAKHERSYKRHKVEPVKLHIIELMDIAEVIAFVAKPGLMQLLEGWRGECRDCKFSKDYPDKIRPCELLAKPVVKKAGGRASARRKKARGRI